jgi:hypothetical protein
MNFIEFKEIILNEYKDYFPHSLCEVYVFCGLGKMLLINFRLAASAAECASGIIGNDCFHVSFTANLPDDYNELDNLPDNIVLECNARSYRVKSKNKYLYCDYKSVQFRKVSGDPEKVLKVIKIFIYRLHYSLMLDYHNNNLLECDHELVRTKGYKLGD